MSKKEISRRSFLKGSAAAGLSVAAAGLLTACGSSDSGSTTAAAETTAAAAETSAAVEETSAAAAESTATEKGVTHIDDWYLWDEETGELNLEGRDATGTTAVVSAGTPWAAQAGISILEQGGNAVDAACAVAFALSVTEPQASGLGGGGFMTIRDAAGDVKFINFRETASVLALDRNYWPLYTDSEGNTSVVGRANMMGGRAIGVPGEVAGMALALEEYGTMSLADVIQPAIDLCNDGFYIGPTTGSSLDDNVGTLKAYPEYGSIYLNDDGMNVTTGDLFKNTQQGAALSLIAASGKDAFYQEGQLRDAIFTAANKYGGTFVAEDFENYEAKEDTPVEGTYRGYKIYSSPLPSSGGLCVIQLLNILENFDIASMGHNTTETLHVLSEAMKLVYADRAKYLGADTEDDLVTCMMSKSYAASLAETISMDEVHEAEAHDPWQFEHMDTSHFTVADKDGNIVSCTQTINGYFGSAVAPEGFGFMLNNEMADFSYEEDSPNNIAPGKCPLSSMSPTVICNEDGSPFMALGSPGGSTIIVAVAQVIMNVIDHGMTMQEAIDAPLMRDVTGKMINYESSIDESVIEELVPMGHAVTESPSDWNRNLGSVQAVLYGEDGTLYGGADPRRDNKALGI
ncbi:MAG: gamma-glutamyltransferase [Lachnospiraceae bacterium]|nr:gamma-glutamyltransferase [Lachnospiraceae bacterium]